MSNQTQNRDREAEQLIVWSTLICLGSGILALATGSPDIALIGFGGAVLGSVLYPTNRRKV